MVSRRTSFRLERTKLASDTSGRTVALCLNLLSHCFNNMNVKAGLRFGLDTESLYGCVCNIYPGCSAAGWSAAVTPAAVEALCVGCPQLRRLSLAGCRDLTPDELLRIASSCGRLQALDLSAVQPHSSSARSPVGPHCLQEVARLLGGRLTSLTLSHNTVGGIQQILNGIGVSRPDGGVLNTMARCW